MPTYLAIMWEMAFSSLLCEKSKEQLSYSKSHSEEFRKNYENIFLCDRIRISPWKGS